MRWKVSLKRNERKQGFEEFAPLPAVMAWWCLAGRSNLGGRRARFIGLAFSRSFHDSFRSLRRRVCEYRSGRNRSFIHPRLVLPKLRRRREKPPQVWCVHLLRQARKRYE